MNTKITATLLIASSAMLTAFAQEQQTVAPAPMTAQEKARADLREDPTKVIPLFVQAARQMKMTIDNEDAIIDELNLEDLEHLPPEEQFERIAIAINTIPKTAAQKRSAMERVFGPQNAEIVDYILADETKTAYVAEQLRTAHVLFNEYERPYDVSNWGWGESWGVTVAPNVGTLGIGLDVGYEINKHWKIRAHYGTGSMSGNMHLKDAKINVGWENKNNAGLLVDWHPRGSQFHVTVGVMYSNPKIKITGDYNYTYDKNTINIAGSGDTSVDHVGGGINQGATGNPTTGPVTLPVTKYEVISHYKMDGEWNHEVQPYVGFGWSSDGGKDRTLFFTFDMGLLYMGGSSYAEHGSYTISRDGNVIAVGDKDGARPNLISATNPNGFGANQSDIPTAAALQRMDGNIRDAINKVAGFLDDMYVYPVIQFGGGIRF